MVYNKVDKLEFVVFFLLQYTESIFPTDYKSLNLIFNHSCTGKVCVRARWPIRPERIPVSVA